jgi:DNA-binding response OmpR family regulator
MPSAKILVIDDDPAMLKLAKLNLSEQGYEVETAGDERAGLGLCPITTLRSGADGFQSA